MNDYVRLGLVLFLISAIASGILAFVNGLTKPIIEENQRKIEIEARQEVLPQAEKFMFHDGNVPYYEGLDEDDHTVGYTFVSSGKGYGGDILTMVGVTSDFSINTIKIISQTETPGLGANCTRPDFTAKFTGKKTEQLIVDKDGGEIESLTGATITTKALTKSISETLNKLIEQVAKGSENNYQEESQILLENEEAA